MIFLSINKRVKELGVILPSFFNIKLDRCLFVCTIIFKHYGGNINI